MMPGTSVGPYVILEKLGEGGMGQVFKARDNRLERAVAIKVLPESCLTDSDRRARFMQEARSASALNHPGIVTIYDILEHDGRDCIVMEFVDGKPLNERIPRKGIPVAEALRIAVQIADALSAAHAAHIVHRDLKPGNIMIDTQGRVKVLDFGLAKLTAPKSAGAAPGEETPTELMDSPLTEEGAIIGSVPYMSPEQAEGRPVDARSDIFSFGAVLYEMVTGQRAFAGESRISTLSAVVGRDPRPANELAPGIPPELERIISRCLRKDVARRSQHMSDVKLALEELRDESESGKLMRPAVVAGVPAAASRRWLWPAIAVACALIAAAAVAWTVLRREAALPPVAHMTRVSPDDSYSYRSPAISPDGKFVAFISDRGGTGQVWLQQIGGSDPIQVTHSENSVTRVQFSPDGTRLLINTFSTASNPQNSSQDTLEIVPTLGGQSRVLVRGLVRRGAFSPDGRQVAYFDWNGSRYVLKTIAVDGGQPRVVEKWNQTQGGVTYLGFTWTANGRALIVCGPKTRDAPNLDEWEWIALPVDGSDPVPMGAGVALRAAGLGLTLPSQAIGDRLVFGGGPGTDRSNVWQIRYNTGSWKISGAPRQLTFGTEKEYPSSISAAGTVAIESSRPSADFYLLPIDFSTGQPSGPARRLTKDGREKSLWMIGGDPGTLYFYVLQNQARGLSRLPYALDLATAQQRELSRGQELIATANVSLDGRQMVYSRPDGGAYSVSVGETGAPPESARTVCRKCGWANRFSPDGRFLTITPEATVKSQSDVKSTVSLLEVSSGKITPWLQDSTDAVFFSGFLAGEWALISVAPPGVTDPRQRRWYIAPWRPTPIPRSEWIEFQAPPAFQYSLYEPYIYSFQKSQLMGMRFDAKQRRFSELFPVRIPPGSAAEVRPTDQWSVRGPGITFAREQSNASVWLMNLPE